MEPAYTSMQSYPYQNGQVHYRPHCYPGVEARPPMSYESWPWRGSCGYAPPGACHGCCNHAYMPAHCAWGSLYSHVPPHHFPGNYPYIPVHYMPLSPYPMMNHPRYEYEKSVPVEHHCCGCRDHPLHQKEQRNLRIEEEEPEGDRGKNDSLVPSQFENSPYPVLWLPPDYNEGRKVKNLEGGKDASRDVEDHGNRKTVKQQPTSWNGWLPLDLNNVPSSKRADGEENSHQDDAKQNFQFPFFWIPYKPYEERGNQKLKDGNVKPSLESEKSSGGDRNFDVKGGNIGEESAPRVKDIPVKEAEQHLGKESSTDMETSVKTRTENGENKIDHIEREYPVDGAKKKSSSPPKSSKLSPVCLRVDPLPRKKSANAKSRSPSPPGDQHKPVEVKSNEAVELRSSEHLKESVDKKTIAVVDGNTSLEKSMNVDVETPGKLPAKSGDDISTKQAEEKPQEDVSTKQVEEKPQEDVSTKQAEEKPQEDVLTKQAEEKPHEDIARGHSEMDAVIKEQAEDIVSTGGETGESSRAEEMKTDSGKKCGKRELSEEEAAVIIQSAYRRFDVSRWKPIEKLRQIAGVREEMADVKGLIREMELSSDNRSLAKQKNIISETIMSLLLRLDTIQGLHPSIREVRKSVVKDLVSLQEHLDAIMNEKPGNSPEDESVMRHDLEDLLSESEDVMSSENSKKINPADMQKQNQIGGGSNPEIPEANPIEEAASVVVAVEAEESSVDEGIKSEQGATTTDEDEKSTNPTDEASSMEIGVEAAESSVDEVVKLAQAPITKHEEEKSNEALENHEASIGKEDHEPMILEHGYKLSSLLDDSSARVTDVVQTEDDETFQSEVDELPQGVLDDLCAAQDTNHSADSSKGDQSPQLEEAPVVEESDYEIVSEGNHQTVSDLPFDGYELKTEETEKGGFEYESGKEEEIGDAASEPEQAIGEHCDEREVVSDEKSEGRREKEGNMEERGDVVKCSGIVEEGGGGDRGVSEMGVLSRPPKDEMREMLVELLKSGQQQLSTLSERVKELEKKLSRKKKNRVKVKHFRAPISDTDTSLGVAM